MEMKLSRLMYEHGGSDFNYFQVNKEMVKKFGFGAALWLANLHEIRKELVINGLIDENDYFPATQQEIKDRTCIAFNAQTKIIETFKEAGIIEVKKKGLPAKNYYWIKKGY